MKSKKEKLFKVDKLGVWANKLEIVKKISFEVDRGEVVALMGPNGSGKSSLAKALMGVGGYKVEGKVVLEGKDLLNLQVDERAKQGLFLAWQNPPAIEGVKLFNLVKESLRSMGREVGSMVELKIELQEVLKRVGLSGDFWQRELNVDMSGGEKKRLLLVLMLMLRPKMIILDEIDSGLDVDSLRIAGNMVRELRNEGVGGVVISHHGKFLDYVKVDRVLVMKEGRVVKEGGRELVVEVEDKGFKS